MAKKASDEECRQNYKSLVSLFNEVIGEADKYDVVYGCGVDVGMMNFVVVRQSTYTYSSYAIGYNKELSELVILPISRELDSYGEAIYLNRTNISKAKQSFISKEMTIKSKLFPKGYIQFSVPEIINQDPDNVCLLVEQKEEAKQFEQFFKTL